MHKQRSVTSQLKTLTSNLLAVGLIAMLTSAPYTARAQQEGDFDESINQELLDSTLGSSAPEDAPPAPEYPYPGASDDGMTPETAPKTAANATHPTPPVVEPNMQIERPKKVDPDTGEYFYDTKAEKALPAAERDADHMPTGVYDNGEYLYSTDLKAPAYSNREGLEKPVEIKANGEFKYAVEQSPISGAASFRVGFFGPPMLKNADTGTTFEQIYTKDQLPVLFADFEIPLTKKLGHIGIKLGSGIFVASGQGQFATVDANRRSDDIAQERYTFLMFPNTAALQYRFQYKDTQPIVPYVEGGAGYFTFAEIRDDNTGPRIGGALTTVAAGGLNFMMDWIDPDAIRNLDTEYGINHVFLTLEAREVVGLNKNYDFTSSAFNAGFLLQF